MVEQVPHGAAGFFQLGRIARLLNRPAEAAGYYAEALALDPLLWQAYEELCSLGARSSVPPRKGIGIRMHRLQRRQHATLMAPAKADLARKAALSSLQPCLWLTAVRISCKHIHPHLSMRRRLRQGGAVAEGGRRGGQRRRRRRAARHPRRLPGIQHRLPTERTAGKRDCKCHQHCTRSLSALYQLFISASSAL